MTIEEMQKQIESMMPTPKQIVENIDKKLKGKDLLLKYLCMALPYDVKVKYKELILGIEHINVYNEVCLEYPYNTYTVDIGEVKPYLRSMSSMTEEEQKEFDSLWNEGFGKALDAQLSGDDAMVKPLEINASSNAIDWLLKNHFDYRNLIEKGLAIAVIKDNNPYKDDL